MTTRAAIVARVSSKGQADNFSPETQIRGMREYAERNGFSEVLELRDVCSGTVPIYERPGGNQLYHAIKARSIDAVIFYTFDRASRDEYAIDFMILQRDLAQAGIELHMTDTGKISDDPFSRIMAFMGIAQAGAERKKILERTQRGRRESARLGAELGRWVGNRPPLGYSKVGMRREARLVINETETAIVQRIYALYLGLGGEKPLTMLNIAVKLTAEKVPVSGRGKKNAPGWTDGAVRYILTNPAYIGEFKHMGVSIKVPELAIITPEIFQAAQKRRTDNARKASRSRKYDYLLAGGYLKCTCGKRMVSRTVYSGGRGKGKRYHYYACVNYQRQYLYSCRELHVRADRAEAVVWEWVKSLLADDASIDAGVRRMAERREIELAPRRERLATVTDLLADYDKRIKRLARGIAEAEIETVAEALQVELKLAGQQREELAEEKSILCAELGQGDLTPEDVAAIKRIAAELRAELADADYQARRFLIDRLDLRLQLRRDEAGRWMDATCGIALNSASLPLAVGISQENAGKTFVPCKNCSATKM